jgi:hypothetical protein
MAGLAGVISAAMITALKPTAYKLKSSKTLFSFFYNKTKII